MNPLRALFTLDPDIAFLNHGSFGATPIPVMDEWQAWQRRLERQPVQFFITDLPDLLATARQALADLIHAGRDDLVFVPNATTAVNLIAHSLDLGPGDDVLTTEQEYGACDYAWNFYSQRQGFRVVRQ
ncbi:MAG: aminotransferase class V-fold PLP-dependent enzyme, partial [Anaerolineae bacterium]